MAQAYKCDRCKLLKEGERHGQVKIGLNDRSFRDYTKTLDLCKDCCIKVDIFISNSS